MVKTIFLLTVQHSKKRCTYLLSLKFIEMAHRIIRKISDGAEKKSRLSFDPWRYYSFFYSWNNAALTGRHNMNFNTQNGLKIL